MRYIYHVYFWYGGEHMTVPFKMRKKVLKKVSDSSSSPEQDYKLLNH